MRENKQNSKGQIILAERKLSPRPAGNWRRRISSFIHHANLYTFITLEQAGLRRFNSQLTLPICQSSHNHFDFQKWRFFWWFIVKENCHKWQNWGSVLSKQNTMQWWKSSRLCLKSRTFDVAYSHRSPKHRGSSNASCFQLQTIRN